MDKLRLQELSTPDLRQELQDPIRPKDKKYIQSLITERENNPEFLEVITEFDKINKHLYDNNITLDEFLPEDNHESIMKILIKNKMLSVRNAIGKFFGYYECDDDE